MSALAGRSPQALNKALPFLKLAMKGYFRSEVRDMERVPDGGALIVSNHSGGLMPMDVPVLAVAFAETFGAERPLYCLAHDMLFTGVAGPDHAPVRLHSRHARSGARDPHLRRGDDRVPRR